MREISPKSRPKIFCEKWNLLGVIALKLGLEGGGGGGEGGEGGMEGEVEGAKEETKQKGGGKRVRTERCVKTECMRQNRRGGKESKNRKMCEDGVYETDKNKLKKIQFYSCFSLFLSFSFFKNFKICALSIFFLQKLQNLAPIFFFFLLQKSVHLPLKCQSPCLEKRQRVSE